MMSNNLQSIRENATDLTFPGGISEDARLHHPVLSPILAQPMNYKLDVAIYTRNRMQALGIQSPGSLPNGSPAQHLANAQVNFAIATGLMETRQGKDDCYRPDGSLIRRPGDPDSPMPPLDVHSRLRFMTNALMELRQSGQPLSSLFPPKAGERPLTDAEVLQKMKDLHAEAEAENANTMHGQVVASSVIPIDAMAQELFDAHNPPQQKVAVAPPQPSRPAAMALQM